MDEESEALREKNTATDYLTVAEVNQSSLDDFNARIGGEIP